MGEVYLAEDVTLDRRVALKVLTPSFASDPARLERFQREAKAVAALNHPNIVTIYAVEDADGIRCHLDGAGRGREPQLVGAPGRPAHPEGLRNRHRARGCARGGTRKGHRSPRPEARQRDDHAGRAREGARLRPCETGARRPLRHRQRDQRRHARGDAHDGRRRRRHGSVYVAGTAAGTARRSPQRPVLARRAAVRAVDGRAPVRGRQRGCSHLQHPARHALAARGGARGHAGRAGANRRALPAQRRARPIPDGARSVQQPAGVVPGTRGRLAGTARLLQLPRAHDAGVQRLGRRRAAERRWCCAWCGRGTAARRVVERGACLIRPRHGGPGDGDGSRRPGAGRQMAMAADGAGRRRDAPDRRGGVLGGVAAYRGHLVAEWRRRGGRHPAVDCRDAVRGSEPRARPGSTSRSAWPRNW